MGGAMGSAMGGPMGNNADPELSALEAEGNELRAVLDRMVDRARQGMLAQANIEALAQVAADMAGGALSIGGPYSSPYPAASSAAPPLALAQYAAAAGAPPFLPTHQPIYQASPMQHQGMGVAAAGHLAGYAMHSPYGAPYAPPAPAYPPQRYIPQTPPAAEPPFAAYQPMMPQTAAAHEPRAASQQPRAASQQPQAAMMAPSVAAGGQVPGSGSTSSGPALKLLRKLFGEHILGTIDTSLPMLELGMDSLSVTEVEAELKEALSDDDFSLHEELEGSMAALASKIAARLSGGPTANAMLPNGNGAVRINGHGDFAPSA